MNDTPCVKLAIFISGNGSNMKALHRAIEEGKLYRTQLELVVSSSPSAGGMAYAQESGIRTHIIDTRQADWDLSLSETLRQQGVTDIALAGFMKVLPARFIDQFPERIYNIHPSLLPKYGGVGMYGQRVHNAVIENSDSESGCTVHLVTTDVDAGPILGQARVSLSKDEDSTSLAKKVLQLEHQLFAKTLDNHFRHRFGETSCTKNTPFF